MMADEVICMIDPDPPQNLSSKKRQKDKHREHRFAEGWVEFMDKKVARSVAEMLNANTIGSSTSQSVIREQRDVADSDDFCRREKGIEI